MIDQQTLKPRSMQKVVDDGIHLPLRYPIVFVIIIAYQFATALASKFVQQCLLAKGTDVAFLMREAQADWTRGTEGGRFAALQVLTEARNGIAHAGAPIAAVVIGLFFLIALVRAVMFAYYSHATVGGARPLNDASIFAFAGRTWPRIVIFQIWAYAGWFFYASAVTGLLVLFVLLMQVAHTGALAIAILGLLFLLAAIVATTVWAVLLQMALVRCVTREEPPLHALAAGIADAGSRIWQITGFALLTIVFVGIASVIASLLASGLEHFIGARMQLGHPLRHVFAGIVNTFSTSVIFIYAIDHLVLTNRHPHTESVEN